MAVSKLKKHICLLQKLQKSRSLAVRRQLLKQSSREVIICLIECIVNILHEKVPLKPSHRKKLVRHAKTIRTLAKVRSEKTARKLLVQKGGSILPLILAPIITAFAANLFGK